MTTKTTQSTTEPISRARVVFSQVVACFALDLLLIDLGMSISFVTMVIPDVLGAKEGLSMNESQASWFGSIAFICQPLGSIFSGPILDYFGRKKALFIVNLPHLFAWILMYCAWNLPMLFFANALLGIGTGIMEAPSITYVGEVSDKSIRGILTTLTNAFTSTGIFMSYLLGTVLPWRTAALVCLIVPVMSMVLVLLVPETPIWLLSKGRHHDALKSLCILRGWAKPEHVEEEFDSLVQYNEVLQQCVICAKDQKGLVEECEHKTAPLFRRIYFNIKYILLAKETLRPFTLVLAYFLFFTMSGLLPIRPNMVNLCDALGMNYNAKKIVVFVGLIFIVLNLASALIVKAIGKRKLVLSSMLGTALCSLAISVYAGMNLPREVFSYEKETFPIEKGILPVVLLMLLVCFTSLGIPWVLLSEVFPFRSRGIASSFAAASSYVFSFIAVKSNYNLEAYLHISGTFAVYSIFGLLGALYLYFFLPETENKTLVEIEKFYQGDHKIFADDFLINSFRKKRISIEATKPMLVK